jgi:hypothetical protein
LRVLIFLGIFLPAILHAAKPGLLQPIQFTWLPNQQLIGSRTADLTWHRIALLRHLSGQRYAGMDEYSASMGGVFKALKIQRNNQELQISIASSLSTRILRPPGNIIVETADFFVDIFIDYKPLPWLAFRTGPGHTSQHLTDDAFEILGIARSLNYVRDYWQAFGEVKSLKQDTRFYVGGFYNYHLIIDSIQPNAAMLQLGFETAPFRLTEQIKPYLAMDYKVRGEVNGNSSINVNFGIRVNQKEGSAMRLGLHYRKGIEDRGQFFRQKPEYWLGGLWLDF